jgi:hypothetical protein
MKMATDSRGRGWICLELPETLGKLPAGKVEVECNSGAERVNLILNEGWADAMSAEDVAAAIEKMLGRP